MTIDLEGAGPEPAPPGVDGLCALLGAERAALARLLELSRRQGELMRAGDVPELQRSSGHWPPAMQAAAAARQSRQRLGAEFERELQREADGPLGRALAALAATAVELGRQNARNRALAGFCLEMVREEAEIFRRRLLEDPAGRYGGDAGRTAAPPGGVLARQA